MRSLDFAFYGEGIRDYGFLLPLVERTLQAILPHIAIQGIRLDKLNVSGMNQVEKMRRIAEESRGSGLVIFHLDADYSDTSRADSERFQPGYAEILKQPDRFNVNIVPLIPVRMTEAWMVVDFDAFRSVIYTDWTASDLGFPETPKQVESIPDPKLTFEQAVKKASSKRRRPRKIPLDEVYLPLSEKIALNKLREVPAYQEFEERIHKVLLALHYISP